MQVTTSPSPNENPRCYQPSQEPITSKDGPSSQSASAVESGVSGTALSSGRHRQSFTSATTLAGSELPCRERMMHRQSQGRAGGWLPEIATLRDNTELTERNIAWMIKPQLFLYRLNREPEAYRAASPYTTRPSALDRSFLIALVFLSFPIPPPSPPWLSCVDAHMHLHVPIRLFLPTPPTVSPSTTNRQQRRVCVCPGPSSDRWFRSSC
ncbi:hypothetical protein QBC47DRAFT_65487 [Echria macrotheca]|uniref:Uncharacterized protein n=1 Tax=Echria macrotheca TaxID=438768 RepID=A0AAJ0B5M3_9PEZI|nr:hypothetical protein QBC47DRAFT_65487 [Echria macrotheca]